MSFDLTFYGDETDVRPGRLPDEDKMGILDHGLLGKDGVLSPAVEVRVEILWSTAEDRRQVREALATYGLEPYEQEQDRVRLAILKLSDGEVGKVLSMTSAAKRDYRDVLMCAEFPEEGRATWALRPHLTQADQDRLVEIRRGDRRQYEEWLKASEK